MHMNRRQALATGTAALTSLLVQTRHSVAAQPTTITISTSISSYTDLLNELAARFTAQNPDIKINYVAKGDNWDPLLQITLRDNLVGNLPDGTWQSLTYAPLLARRGIAQPINALFDTANNPEAFGLSPALVDSISVNGDLFAVPFGTTVPVVYYNLDLLKRAGYETTESFSTWDAIIEAGKKVAALDKNINGGFFEYEATNAWMFQNILGTFGGRMMNADQTNIAFDSSEGLEALETLWQFGETNNINMTRNQARQAFNAGTSGIHIRSASGTTSVSKAAAGQFALEVGQLPVPSSKGYLVGAGHGFLMFTKERDRQEALWKFVSFAASPEGQMILAKNTGYMPVNTLALNDSAFRAQYLEVNPYHRSIIEKLAITSDQFSFPSDNTVKIVDMISEEMRKVVLHETKPDQALATMAEQARKLLGIG